MIASYSALLVLPSEIRCLIYQFVFEGVQLRVRSAVRSPSEHGRVSTLNTSILRTCRQCRREATPVLYSTVAIHPDNGLALVRLKERAGLENYQRISNLVLHQYGLVCHSPCADEITNLTGLRYLTIHFGPVTADVFARDHGIPRWRNRTEKRTAVGPNFQESMLNFFKGLWTSVLFPRPIIKKVDGGFAVLFCITVNTDSSLKSYRV